jgi:hypothetical protein
MLRNVDGKDDGKVEVGGEVGVADGFLEIIRGFVVGN